LPAPVDDLDTAIASLAALGLGWCSDVREPTAGVRVADLSDPEVNVLSLEERRSPA
jgi:hypothetical protein